MTVRRRLVLSLSLLGVVAAMAATAFGASTTWGTAIGVPGLENTAEDQITSISCVSPGHCTAAGMFRKGFSFVVNEKAGVWGSAISVPYGDWSYLYSISCATAG